MKTPNGSECPQGRPLLSSKARRKNSKRREEVENALRLATGLSPQEMSAILERAQDEPLSRDDYNKLKGAFDTMALEITNLPD